jgi:hypothetical protein
LEGRRKPIPLALGETEGKAILHTKPNFLELKILLKLALCAAKSSLREDLGGPLLQSLLCPQPPFRNFITACQQIIFIRAGDKLFIW